MSAADYPDWFEHALCSQTDSESFYPNPGESTRPARKVCASCPVATQCLAYALANDERHGVWAGTTPDERARMRRGAA
jgi:WhiB family redox-sensing transcriptional regulator